MRPSTLKLLMSTTSLAALVAVTGGSGLIKPARALDLTISTNSTTPVAFPGDVDGTLTINNAVTLWTTDDGDTIYVGSVTPNGAKIDNNGSIGQFGCFLCDNGNAINVDQTNTFTINNIGPGSIIFADPNSEFATIFVTDGAKTAINNDGQIVNYSDEVSGLAAVAFGGSNTGDLTNKSTGYIGSQNGDAVYFNGGTFTGKLDNAGTIEATNGTLASSDGYTTAAIRLNGSFDDLKITGGIINTGKIVNKNLNDDFSSAILVEGTVAADVTNKAGGSIQGNREGGWAIVTQGGTTWTGKIVNEAKGTIEATGTGGGAIGFSNSKLVGSIDNYGTIQVTDNTVASGTQAIYVFNSEITNGITNRKGGVIQATGQTSAAIEVVAVAGTAKSDITNSGTIKTTSSNTAANAIIFADLGGGTAAGTITNTADGTISLSGAGLNAIQVLGGQVKILNSGDIVTTSTNAKTHAIYIGSVVDIINSKKISTEAASSASAAIFVADDQTGIIDNGALADSKTTGQIFNKNGGIDAIAIEIAKDATVSKGIVNQGLLQGGDGSKNGNDGFAIFQNNNASDGTTEITNKVKGTIVGRVQIAQGTFNIEGGTVTGDTTGADSAVVNFNLAPAGLETVPGDGGFNPQTAVNGDFGFNTGGKFTLATGNDSGIQLNSGALFVHHDMQAETVFLTNDAIMRLDDGVTITAPGSIGVGLNSGTVFVDGDATAHIVGNLFATGASSKLGFGVRHVTVGSPDYGQLTVSGTTDINTGGGSTLVRIYNDGAGFTPAAKGIVLIDGTGTLSVNNSTVIGTLADMDTTYNDTATLKYQARIAAGNDLVLDVTRTNFSVNGGLTPNEQAAGGALETVAGNGKASPGLDAIIGQLDSITDVNQLGNALKQLLPIANGAALYGSMVGFDAMLNSIDSRLKDYDQPGYGQQYVNVTVNRTETGLSGAAAGRRNGLWVRAGGGTGEQDTRGGPGGDVAGFDGRTYYGVIGLDREAWEGLRIGITGAFADSRFKGNADDVNNSRLNVRNYQGSAYVAWNDPSGWWASLVGGGGYNTYEGRRSINIVPPIGDPIVDTKSSEYNGWMATAKAMLGKTFGDEDGITIAPFVSLRYSHVSIDKYTETGVTESDLNLTVGKQTYDSVLPGVGLRLAATLHAGNVTLVPWIRGTYQYDVIGDRQQTSASFGGDLGSPLTTFTTIGLKPGQQIANGGAGLNIFTSGPFTMALNYDYEWRDNGFTGHSGYFQGRLGF